jgi:TolB-like protein/class 3 adenylate cyclase
MAQARVERRLTAILAADVAGYSRLMGADEEGTLQALKEFKRDLLDPKIAEHRGRIVNTAGDGFLAEFASAVDAVRCAMEIQRGMAEHNASTPEDRRIELRIGVNIGDIIVDADDIYGDGVNIAARIEALARPGSICLSEHTYQQVKGKLSLAVQDMGEQRLKNIALPVRVYAVRLDGDVPASIPLPLPDKPSIAVLPFNNMSGDPEQDYFADGMVEDIITALSHFPHLFVIARNSSFVYKNRVVNIKQVGRELGVRYVLEGSVRKDRTSVRISGQLIDALNGAHLWAGRFDGTLEDIFDLQDRIAASVVAAIIPKLEQAEIERAKRKPTESLDAYDYYLRGMAAFHAWTRKSTDEALHLFLRAIELDPEFAAAYGMAAFVFLRRKANGWMSDRPREIAETARLARAAADFGKSDAFALLRAGQAFASVVQDLETGAGMIDRALVLNPNLTAAWIWSGWVKIWRGEPEESIECLARAMRLSPLQPRMFGMQIAAAHGHFFAGRHEEAATWAAKGLLEQPVTPRTPDFCRQQCLCWKTPGGAKRGRALAPY